MSPRCRASPKAMTRPRVVNNQYPCPDLVPDSDTTDSRGANHGALPKWGALPKAYTRPRSSTIQYPLKSSAASMSTAFAAPTGALPCQAALPKAYTDPLAPTIQYPERRGGGGGGASVPPR